MRKIGIVEDDRKLGNELTLFLSNNGFHAVSLPETEFSVEGILSSQLDMVLFMIWMLWCLAMENGWAL